MPLHTGSAISEDFIDEDCNTAGALASPYGMTMYSVPHSGEKGSLPFITFTNSDQVVCASEVKLSIDPGLT